MKRDTDTADNANAAIKRDGVFFSITDAIKNATRNLAESVAKIVTTPSGSDEQASLLGETFSKFEAQLGNEVEKLNVETAVTKDFDMTAIAKALGLAEDAKEDEVLKAVELLKAAPKAEEKEEEVVVAKAEPAPLPEHVVKALQEGEDLKKRIAALEDERELAGFAKRAGEIGLPETDAVVLQKAYRGDKASIDALLGYVKAAQTQAKKAGLFTEIGSAGRGAATAFDEITAKAEELRKADKKLSKAQAFARVYEDSDNSELVMRYKQEEARALNS
jgi:hypothetical protein